MDESFFRGYSYSFQYSYDGTNTCKGFSKLMYLLLKSKEVDKNKIIQYIANNKDQINSKNEVGFTSLHFIACNGEILKINDLIEPLIINGADINSKTNKNSTPLILSLVSNNYEAAKLLLKNRASVNDINEYGSIALNIAVRRGKKEDVDNTIIHSLLDHGSNTKLIRSKNYRNALMLACKNSENENNCETIKMLINYGANPNVQDKNGITALMIACRKSNYGFAKILLENSKNIDINMYDHKGLTALMHACINSKYNNVKIIELFYEYGADFNAVDNEGNSALIHACKNKKKSYVDSLLKYGSYINLKNNSMDTAINIAFINKCEMDIILNLIDHGADYQERDSSRNTYLKYISERSDEEQNKFMKRICLLNHYRIMMNYVIRDIKNNKFKIIKSVIDSCRKSDNRNITITDSKISKDQVISDFDVVECKQQ